MVYVALGPAPAAPPTPTPASRQHIHLEDYDLQNGMSRLMSTV